MVCRNDHAEGVREAGKGGRVSPGQAWEGSDLHTPWLLSPLSLPPLQVTALAGSSLWEAVTVIPTVAVVIAGAFPEDRCVPGTEPSPFSPPPQLQEGGMERWGGGSATASRPVSTLLKIGSLHGRCLIHITRRTSLRPVQRGASENNQVSGKYRESDTQSRKAPASKKLFPS